MGDVKQIWINKIYIAKITTAILSGLYAFLGFVAIWVPLGEILSDTLSVWVKIVISLGILVGAWCICFIMVGCFLKRKKRFEIISVNNGKKLYLQYGDLFNENEVIYPKERRNIVIPVNRCFDTIVDNHIVSEQSLHGMALKRLYNQNRYSSETLDIEIKQLLSRQEYEELDEKDKPLGNRYRYPVGTVVNLPVTDREYYLLWALSTFDSNFKAHTSMQDFALAIQRLIEACGAESEGFSIVMPLVGSGLSRTKKEQRDILAYLISAFKINRSEINSDIHIVIREDLKNEIAIANIK